MTETPLDAIRRQIREAEERLKNAPAGDAKTRNPLSEMRERSPEEIPLPESRPSMDPLPNRNNAQLRSLQRRFRALLEAAKDAFILVDAEGNWELANHHLPRWLGYTLEEFRGVNPTKVFEPRDVKHLLSSFPRWISGEEPLTDVTLTLNDRNGERIPVQVSTHSWSAETGERLAYLVLQDARGRRDMEDEIATAKAFIDAVMRGGTVPILLMRSDGVIIDVNEAACKFLGAASETLLNTPLRDYVAGSSHLEFDMIMSRALNLEPSTNIYCRLQPAGGEQVGSRMYLVGVADARGKFNRILATMEKIHREAKPEDSSADWSAYGRMTPGLLKELAGYITTSVRDAAEHVHSRDADWGAQPDMVVNLLQNLDRVRATLAAWVESAECLGKDPGEQTIAGMIQEAVEVRRPELDRWGIAATLHLGNTSAREMPCPPNLFPAVLHILQSCIEELRESSGGAQLAIRIQGTRERLETSFHYEVSTDGEPAGAKTEEGISEYRSTSLELRAAQKLLESMGGNLVLENVTGTQRAVRMNVSLAALAGGAQGVLSGKKGGVS